MARRKRKQAIQVPFTKVPEPWLTCLHEAKVSGVELLVLLALAEHPQRNGYLSRPVGDFNENMTGIMRAIGVNGPKQVDKALSTLQKKSFTDPSSGEKVPILTSVVKAKPGTCAVYRCNLPSKWPDVEPEQTDEQTQEGAEDETGTQSDTHTGTQSDTHTGTQSGEHAAPNQTPHLEKGLEALLGR